VDASVVGLGTHSQRAVVTSNITERRDNINIALIAKDIWDFLGLLLLENEIINMRENPTLLYIRPCFLYTGNL
jgi:hypothetical protein